MTKHTLTLRLLTLLATVALTTPLSAQEEYFTLTNGRHLLYYSSTWDANEENFPRAYWTERMFNYISSQDTTVPIYPYGESNLSLITKRGDRYLRLIRNFEAGHEGDPAFELEATLDNNSTLFDTMCLWKRTGYTGYYYQEWDNNRYYIVGSSLGLKVVTVPEGSPTEELVKWYNWDFGAAVKEVSYHEGKRLESYYWLMYDTDLGKWKMSCNSYQRPEDELYEDYDPAWFNDQSELNIHKSWYCPNGATPYATGPAGRGALYLPVTVTQHGLENISMPEGVGFNGVTVKSTDVHDTVVTLMKFGETAKVKLVVNELTELQPLGTGANVLVSPPYTHCAEEIYRYGINTNYRNRSTETFGSAGIPTIVDHYYYKTSPSDPVTEHATPPDPIETTLGVDSVHYSLDRSSRRYFRLSTEMTLEANPSTPVTISCYEVPRDRSDVILTVTVYFDNGTQKTLTYTIIALEELQRAPFRAPQNGPVIRGYVVGGGRIANVGYDFGDYTNNIIEGGNTSITVHSCDSIYSLYGGNDIAGWVQGHATIQLGTAYTSAQHPVKIDFVFGGGCGYYAYQDVYDANKFFAGQNPRAGSNVLTSRLGYGEYCFTGAVYPWRTAYSQTQGEGAVEAVATGFDYLPYAGAGGYDFNFAEKGQNGNGTVPYIKSAHITVGVPGHPGNDYILIDSLFGGAENSFIGVQSNETSNPANAISIDIWGGAIFSAFGGNNFGGSVAQTSTVFVNVHDTKKPTGYNEPFTVAKDAAGEVVFTPDENFVEASDASFLSGYGREYGIRYLFGGGNIVDGSHANVTITGGMIDTCFLGGNRATVTTPIGTVNCTGANFICNNPSYDSATLRNSLGSDEYFGPDSWAGEVGNYNIRGLFGGNNLAPMDNLALINLVSGGVSSVYGGGNAGDMNNRGLSLSVDKLRAVMRNVLTNIGVVKWPSNMGAIVYTPSNSQIKCDYIFGGCRMANVWGSSGVVLNGGMFGYVNGGNDVSGDVGSTSYMIIRDNNGDSIGKYDASYGKRDGAYVFLDSNVVVVGDVVGGSDGYYHCDDKTGHYDEEALYDTYSGENYDPYNEYVGYLLPTHNNVSVSMKGGLVKGSLIAGGVHANVGFSQDVNRNRIKLNGVEQQLDPQGGTENGTIRLNITGGKVEGNVFGGGYMSTIYGLSYIHVADTAIIEGSLFAGNDLVGAIEGLGAYIKASDSIPNEANYSGCVSSNNDQLNYFDGSSWNALYSSYVLLEGTPRINCVYGGGNGAYNYNGNRPEYGDEVYFCEEGRGVTIPIQSSSFIDINLADNHHPHYLDEPCIDTVFGGGNGAGVRDNVVVLLNCEGNTEQTVNTIFGGNNRDNMTTCVPDILLVQGKVKDVYGGGNRGSMSGVAKAVKDICGNDMPKISTYIKVNNANAIVDGTIYGGCRMADVAGMAYIDIRDGEIKNVFGGNDISGTVSGNTRIDVNGGTVYNIHGGSNGKYDYAFVNNSYTVYTYHSTHNAANLVTSGVSDRPFVDSTTINLYGGTIRTDVFGGGALGDCRATNVVVNDLVCPSVHDHTLSITGTIYAGGEGNWEDLNEYEHNTFTNVHRRFGNVFGTDNNPNAACYLHLHHASQLQDALGFAKAYGGGKGGDVTNTYVYSYPTWDIPFQALYGGCWGSDVYGTTHLDLQGGDVGDAQTANNVYGGNDFTGSVYKTDITIRNGKYGFVYGGGNGDYPEGYYTGSANTVNGVDYSVYAGTYVAADVDNGYTQGISKRLFEPNNEYAVINVWDGTIDSSLFGGGKMGTTMHYKRKDDGSLWASQGGGASKKPDTFRSLKDYQGNDWPNNTPADSLPNTNAEDYSHIIVNIHGGTFEHNVYGGGAGKPGGPWIVYGLKEVNMDGGIIKESLYGGSENVSDGYARECKNIDNSTKRPSSILNIAGGTIRNHVYAGGYLGDVHGSAYINVGTQAIEHCPVWTSTIYGTANAYAAFKPGAQDGHTPAMTASELLLQASIYGGANWGNNVGSADFRKAGYYGGESRISVDGQDYNTYMDAAQNDLPLMNISNSIIGAGTSASGGDIYNRIDIRNYGAIGENCKPTRKLRSIQRADVLYLRNTAIDYTGSTDAISAYLSEQYTINRVDTINCRGYNIVDVDATMTNIGTVNFYWETGAIPWETNNRVQESDWILTTRNIPICTPDDGSCTACGEHLSVCDQLGFISRETYINNNRMQTAFVMNNGINVDFITEDGDYAAVNGFGFIVAEDGTNAVITARAKYGDVHADDGGFMPVCTDSAKAVIGVVNTTEIQWCDCGGENMYSSDCTDLDTYLAKYEYRYDNYGPTYRMWTIGQGVRRRYVVIQAHSNPDSLYTSLTPGDTIRYNKKLTFYDTTSTGYLYNFGIAHATLRLPPTTPGHYYKMNHTKGVVIADENSEMRLVDVGYVPKNWNAEPCPALPAEQPAGCNLALSNEWLIESDRAWANSDVNGTDYEHTDHGSPIKLGLDDNTSGGTLLGYNYIKSDATDRQYFGLAMVSGNNFAVDNSGNPVAPDAFPQPAGWLGGSTISGNAYTNLLTNFTTAKVGANEHTMPEIDFYMLYDNDFSHTLIGTVTFTLDEYESVRLLDGYNGVDLSSNTGNPIDFEDWNTAHNTDIQAGTITALTSDYLEKNLYTPIEVEVTISTILQDFNDMEYTVLAMYNEGRSNSFERKVVLPATLQRRELYLQGISWFPTDITTGNGDTLRTTSNPTHFYLTDSKDLIKNQDATEHSYFGMSIKPMDNISNSLVSSVGWHSISIEDSLNLYSTAIRDLGLSGHTPKRVSSTDEGKYYQEAYDPTAEPPQPEHKLDSVEVRGGTHGTLIGILDGRGEAAIKIALDYDGSRVYEDTPGKGFVGKVVLTLVSYAGGDYEHGNPFHLIINVKTREKGDTIYLASAQGGFNRGSYHVDQCTVEDLENPVETKAGKRPDKYLTSFYDALTKVYEEGDVIAIIDTLKIDGTLAANDVFIHGQEYMPIPVIRYTGTHTDLPGEVGVYRGPMIVVDGPNAVFRARCIDFQGGMLGKIEPADAAEQTTLTNAGQDRIYDVLNKNYDKTKWSDTTKAFGPIIAVKNNATVALQQATTVRQNYNGYGTRAGDDYDAHPEMMGAISVTSGGTLSLINDITIYQNLSEEFTVATDIHPLNGAVYLDGGTIMLENSAAPTAILIKENYLHEVGVHFWLLHTTSGPLNNVPTDNLVIHTDFNDANYAFTNPDCTKANVYLAREEATIVPGEITGDENIQNYKDTVDSQTERIVFDEYLTQNTRIGVSKWFPGRTLRDTIQIVFQADATALSDVEQKGNFFSDNPNFFTFYEYGVNNQRMYLGRCATFRFQELALDNSDNVLELFRTGSGILTSEALTYHTLNSATCPTGGDTMVVRAIGGFFPYTFRWEDESDNLRQPVYAPTYNHATVSKAISTGGSANWDIVRASIADTLVTTRVNMTHDQTSEDFLYHVTITDATDHCTLTKNVNVKFIKDVTDTLSRQGFFKKVDPNQSAWASLDKPNTVGNTAYGERRYPAVKITPQVWTTGSGTIAAAVYNYNTNGENSYYLYYYSDGEPYLGNLAFCDGDVIRLATSPTYHLEPDESHPDYDPETGQPTKCVYDSKFIMWDFSPYYKNPITYVVPPENTTVTAYFGPNDYWIDTVDKGAKAGAVYDDNYTYPSRPLLGDDVYTSTDGTHKAGYVTTYNGDVHIYDENGLAWFISVVNGLNGQQARPFYFNNVYLHKKLQVEDGEGHMVDDPYNMEAHLWTPVGSMQHPFRGRFYGVDGDVEGGDYNTQDKIDTCTVPATTPVEITNIILDEPNLDNVGFFAFLDTAQIKSIKLSSVLARGSQYVGALAARSTHARIDNCQVTDDDDVENTLTTILTTHYACGGMLGRSDNDVITNASVEAKGVGDAVYSGGVIGYGISTRVYNTGVLLNSRMNGLYLGGVAGYLDGTAPANNPTPSSHRAKSDAAPSVVANNYVHLITHERAQRVGGIVGYAKNSLIENNYAYGVMEGSATEAGVGAVLDEGAQSDHNYYEQKAVNRSVGQMRANAVAEQNTSFAGSGNSVQINESVYGVNNLTRVLNIWVRSHEGDYKSWRSDLESTNHGYPLFGTPDIIPVSDSLTVTGCDSVEWDGQVYLFDDEMVSRIIDSTLMIDSTYTLRIVVHHASREQVSDTVTLGDPYSGYGFYLTATEVALLQATMHLHGTATVVLQDTLQNATGCDSIVTLYLTVNRQTGITETPTEQQIRVYPNPTTSRVTIESTAAMSHVELYDNEGRRLQDYTTHQRNDITIDVSQFPTGAYYLRVHTADNVTIQKLIKK